MTTLRVTWHPDAVEKALAALIKARDEFDAIVAAGDTIPLQQARIRLNKVTNDLFDGNTIPVAIDALRATRGNP